MDIDMSDSDMSRLTTMLVKAGCAFERGYAAGSVRTIEIGNVEFSFGAEGEILDVEVWPASAD